MSGSGAGLPRSSGIYRITCVPTGTVYIGQSVDLRARYSTHRSALKVGINGNPHLKSAWDKYGPDAFVFDVLARLSKGALNEAEYRIIREYQERGVTVFNVRMDAAAASAYNQPTKHKAYCPKGHLYRFTEVENRCGGKGLRARCPICLNEANEVWREKRRQADMPHQVAVHRAIKARADEICERFRKGESVESIRADLGVSHSPISRLLHTRGLKTSVASMAKAAHTPRLYRITSPDGAEHSFSNCTRFAEEHGLNGRLLHSVTTGKRPHHRGWTKPIEPIG